MPFTQLLVPLWICCLEFSFIIVLGILFASSLYWTQEREIFTQLFRFQCRDLLGCSCYGRYVCCALSFSSVVKWGRWPKRVNTGYEWMVEILIWIEGQKGPTIFLSFLPKSFQLRVKASCVTQGSSRLDSRVKCSLLLWVLFFLFPFLVYLESNLEIILPAS